MLLKNELIASAYVQNTGSEYIEADCSEESIKQIKVFICNSSRGSVFSLHSRKTRPERVMTVGNISSSSIADNFIVFFFFFPPTNQEVIFS